MKRHRPLQYVVLAVVAVTVAFVLIQAIRPKPEERLLTQTLQALEAGDIERAESALESMADLSRDSTDQAAIWAVRMGLAIARLATAAQLELEYAILAERQPPESPLHASYNRRSEELRDAMPQLMEEMVEIAQTYRGRHYREGLRLESPLMGTLPIPESDTQLEDALAYLMQGDDSAVHHETLRLGIAKVAAAAILERLIEQPEPRPADEVVLSGRLQLAELLWLIGSNSPNRELARWSMRRVLDETEDDPQNPLRKRAQDVLAILQSM